MKKLVLLIIMILITTSSFAYTGQEAVSFVKNYIPYTKESDTISVISVYYAHTVFFNADIKQWTYDKPSGNIFIVTTIFTVDKPRPDILEVSSPLAQQELMKVKGELNLEWRVDMDKKIIEPYNFLARDSLTLYEEMFKGLGVSLYRE